MSQDIPFNNIPKGKFGAILADPPWHFEVWSMAESSTVYHPSEHYKTMSSEDIYNLPVKDLAAPEMG